MAKLLMLLQQDMKRPEPFGSFHLAWIFMAIFAIVFLSYIKTQNKEKQLKFVLGAYSFIALGLELLKQIIWTITYDPASGFYVFDYQWYAAPFQLCTTPAYVCCLCFFLRPSKLRNALLSYVSYVTILGSIATILAPNSCFSSDILVNVHTMWLHVGSFVVSVYLIRENIVENSIQNLKSAWLVFVSFVGCALLLNVIVFNSNMLNGDVFNMFYISPYFPSTLPVFDVIYQKVSYLAFLLSYIFAILLGSFLIHSTSAMPESLHQIKTKLIEIKCHIKK